MDSVPTCWRAPPLDAFRVWFTAWPICPDQARPGRGAAHRGRAGHREPDLCAGRRGGRRLLRACAQDGSMRPGLDPADVLLVMGFMWRTGPDDAGGIRPAASWSWSSTGSGPVPERKRRRARATGREQVAQRPGVGGSAARPWPVRRPWSSRRPRCRSSRWPGSRRPRACAGGNEVARGQADHVLQAGEGEGVAVRQRGQRGHDPQPGGDVDQRVEFVVSHGRRCSAVRGAGQLGDGGGQAAHRGVEVAAGRAAEKVSRR